MSQNEVEFSRLSLPSKKKPCSQSQWLLGNVVTTILRNVNSNGCRPYCPPLLKAAPDNVASILWPVQVTCSCLPSFLWLDVIRLGEVPQNVLLTSQKYIPPWLWSSSNSSPSSGGFFPRTLRANSENILFHFLSVENFYDGQREGCIEC